MERKHTDDETPKILIVDDIDMNVAILDNILQSEGYDTMCATNVHDALELIKVNKPSLVLSDLSMPEIDGMEFCRMLKSNPKTRDIPFVFITVLDTTSEKENAFSTGAVDFIPKPFDSVEVIMRVRNHITNYQLKQQMGNYNRMMHKLVDEQKKKLEQEQENVLMALVKLMGKRDEKLGAHMENVGYNSRIMAQGLQLLPKFEHEISDKFIETIEKAAMLHDIGGFILADQAEISKNHPEQWNEEYIKNCLEKSSEILEEICVDQIDGYYLTMAIEIVNYHYANWNGTGYPALKGANIPLEARIVALLDDFDSSVSRGTDMAVDSVEEKIKLINENSGVYYDPDLVDVFNKIWRQMKVNEHFNKNV